jgi:hypothetical protein
MAIDEDNVNWIFCEQCNQWYHEQCITIDSKTKKFLKEEKEI